MKKALKKHSGNSVPKGAERSCSDCGAYLPINKLIDKKDGRKICPKCQEEIRVETAERIQPDMFAGHQKSLLEASE